jgi:hypothetical protein
MAPHTGSTAGVLWYSTATKDCQIARLQLQSRSGFGERKTLQNSTLRESYSETSATKKHIR